MMECRECWWRHKQLNQQRCDNLADGFTSREPKKGARTVPVCSLSTQKSLHTRPTAALWCCTSGADPIYCSSGGGGGGCSLNKRTETPRLVFRCPAGRGMEGLRTSPTGSTMGTQIYSNSNRDRERRPCPLSSSRNMERV